jgi:hypothetical protein
MSNTDTNGNGEIVEAVVVQSQELAPAGLFKTDDPVEVVERATRVADSLKDVISQRELYTMIQGKPHVRVEGWQLVGAMLGVTAVCVETVEVEGGWKATVEARTADGRVIGSASALCTKNEKRGPWKSADDYARLSMAQTRATSKALKGPLGFVISLAGYQTTPAEEMTFIEADPVAEVEPATPPELISAEAAAEIVNDADGFGLLETLQLAASHVAGFDVGDCSTKPKAKKALQKLSAHDGERLNAWISKKADEQVTV